MVDYVDWVQIVASGAFQAWNQIDAGERMLGASLDTVIEGVGLSVSDELAREAIGDALVDLETLGLLEFEHRRYVKLTQEGRKLGTASLSTAWPRLFETFIDDNQRQQLESLVRLSVEPHERFARLREVSGEA